MAARLDAYCNRVGITLMLGVLVLAWFPEPKALQFLVLPGWPAGLPNGYVRALAMLMLFVGMTANDGFAACEGAWLAALIFRLPACMGWLLPPADVSLALPYAHTALGCWIAFFLWRHGDRFVYAAVSILALPLFLAPGIGPAIKRVHSKVFTLRRASEQPPSDSE
jgi:hypothetical protein